MLWKFVGGRVERGGTKKQALIHECREELVITLTVGRAFVEVNHRITTKQLLRYEFCPADEAVLKKLRSGNAAR